MITDFYFLDVEFSEFRVDSLKQNTEPLPIPWILWLFFYSFSGFKKISMSITWSYEIFNVLFIIRTKKDSERFTKCYKGESSKGISNTENCFPLGGGKAPRTPHQGFALDPIWAPPPQHTKVWIGPWITLLNYFGITIAQLWILGLQKHKSGWGSRFPGHGILTPTQYSWQIVW